jgi:tetrahydromethanopterin S-methyltransferase subunit D
MNKLFTRLMLLFFSLCSSSILFAQEAPGSEELMRSNGKIYVVVAVCLTILIGLFLYVYSVDRKISKTEKEN